MRINQQPSHTAPGHQLQNSTMGKRVKKKKKCNAFSTMGNVT